VDHLPDHLWRPDHLAGGHGAVETKVAIAGPTEPTFKQMLFWVDLCSAEGSTEPKADAQSCRFGVQRLFQMTFSVFEISYNGQVRECPQTVC
jgi:hypothetical protein